MSNRIESFLVACGPKDNKIDIIDNLNKFGVSVCAILCQVFIKSGKLSSGPFR